MRASRLVALLIRLQTAGGASASELAEEFEVSTRTIYRDVAALEAAGVPVFTEVGRNGGVRIDPSYRVGGLPRLGGEEARAVLFAAVPAIARQLGLDTEVADRALLPSMDVAAEAAARIVRERLVVEPSHWFVRPDEAPALGEIARSVWETREVRLDYRGVDTLLQPLGLVYKGDTWYVLGVARGEERLFRLSRIGNVRVLDQRFDRPPEFDLATAWEARRRAFLELMTPRYDVRVRVAPGAERQLAWLAEARPELPLPADIERDEQGWAVLDLRFEHADRAVRYLLQLGVDAEVLDPPELRTRLGEITTRLAALYRADD